LEVVEGVRHLLMVQYELHDVHEAAVRKAENCDLSHDLLRYGVCPRRTGTTRRGDRGFVTREIRGLSPPERLIGLAKSLFPRDADILQEVNVVGLGDLA